MLEGQLEDWQIMLALGIYVGTHIVVGLYVLGSALIKAYHRNFDGYPD